MNFRLSSYLSKKQKEEHFKELFDKISKKALKISDKIVVRSVEDAMESGSFVFSGELYYLEYSKNRGVKLVDNNFIINFHTSMELIEKHILKLLTLRYYSRLNNYVNLLNSQTYNFNINGFELKNLNSKWGHCTHDNRIMLNLKLLNASKEVLDYVIIHELAHIKHKNHSATFWYEVSRYCPNYKRVRKYLKENPPQIYKLLENG
ncbi:MAG: M48 family metallopeptidase [Nanoarchaeota archaeon]|nr:M48 family metallopeptidase [Nanoarchaeota archaeon]